VIILAKELGDITFWLDMEFEEFIQYWGDFYQLYPPETE